MAFRLKKYLSDVKAKLALADPIMISPYIGYGSKNYLYCRGRVLENEILDNDQTGSVWKNFVNNLKRIESDEIPNVPLTITFHNKVFRTKTNQEGFYSLERKLDDFKHSQIFEPIEIEIPKRHVPAKYKVDTVKTKGEIFYPPTTAKFGVITDIDDTLLKTDVLSNFKWKAMYNTMFIKAEDRSPIWFVDQWYRKLSKGLKKEGNPFFYISHSPWNLFDYLIMFLRVNRFPKGPVFLRDFGLKNKKEKHLYFNHKTIEIKRIFKTYPHLSFVLIGDGAERDPDIYIDLHKQFPGRVKAIFIRPIGNAANKKRLAEIAEEHPDYFFLIKTGKEGMKYSKELGLII